MTLSLEDVASRVGMNSPAEAERQLVSMIEEGSIFARISQKDGKLIYGFPIHGQTVPSFPDWKA